MNEHEKLKTICDKIGYISYWKDGDNEGELIINEIDDNNLDDYIAEGEISYIGDTFYKRINSYVNQTYMNYTELDVREIIFTPEFIEKLALYLFDFYDEDMIKRDNAINGVLFHLDNSVEYLYNLIK